MSAIVQSRSNCPTPARPVGPADLGVQLIERTTRSMRVTQIGEQVYERVRAMLGAGQAALDLVDALLGAVRGLLRLAIPVDLGVVALPPILDELQSRHPELRVDVVLGDQPIDLIRLCHTEEIFVAPPGFAATHPVDSIQDLVRVPRIAHSVVDGLSSTLHHPDGRTVELTLALPVVSVASSDLMRGLVGRGLGMTMIPELFVREELQTDELVRVAAPWRRRRVEVYALTPSRVTSPAVMAFLEALRNTLAGGREARRGAA